MDGHTELGKVRIPFTAYDVFGYLIPGITLVSSLLLFEVQLHHSTSCCETNRTPGLALLKDMQGLIGDSSWLVLLFVLVGILGCYVVGHIVATLSSFLIDRIFIFRGYGYPSDFLLSGPSPSALSDPISRPIYRGLFFWLGVYSGLRYVHLVFPGSGRVPGWAANIIGYGIAALLLIAFVGSEIRNRKTSMLHNYFYESQGRSIRRLGATVMRAQASLYDWGTRYLSNYLDSRKAFDSDFVERFHRYFEATFHMDARMAATNRYWFSYCYVIDKSPVLGAMLTNWLHLYAFARNLALAFFVAFLLSLEYLRHYSPIASVGLLTRLFPAAFLFFACALLIRYYYLYVCYYSRFLFRAFVYLSEMSERAKRK